MNGDKYYARLIMDQLNGPKSLNKVRLLFGARQTGKTVLLRQLVRDGGYLFNLQDIRVRQRLELDPAAFVRELEALGPTVSSVGVDEIQKVPALLDEIQFLYDQQPERWQFFLTGSSARRLRTHSANLLPGRAHVYHLYPLIRSEEQGVSKNYFPVGGVTGERFDAASLERRLLLGDLPGIRREPEDVAVATLEAYVENYLEEEIRREGLVRDIGHFHIFLKLAALASGYQVNIAKLSRESGIAASTIRTFYEVLADTFAGYWIHSYRRTGRKRLVSTPRFLFFDLGVRNAAAGAPLKRTLTSNVGGYLLEYWVGLELLRRSRYGGRQYDLSFWRCASGAEVDYVWQAPSGDIPVEVKWTDRPRPEDARHVEKFLDLYPKTAQRGFVVCRVDHPQQLTKRTLAIPWQAL